MVNIKEYSRLLIPADSILPVPNTTSRLTLVRYLISKNDKIFNQLVYQPTAWTALKPTNYVAPIYITKAYTPWGIVPNYLSQREPTRVEACNNSELPTTRADYQPGQDKVHARIRDAKRNLLVRHLPHPFPLRILPFEDF